MKKEYGYPTLKVICQASAGNENAIREILKFHDAEELKGQIHTEMIKAILKFEIRVK